MLKKIFEQRIKEQVVCVYKNSNNDVFIGNSINENNSFIEFSTQESIRIMEIIDRIKKENNGTP